jgi:hexosaminidase
MEGAAYHLLEMSAPVPDLLFPPRAITPGEGRLALTIPRHLPGTLAEAATWLEVGAPAGWSARLDPRLGGEHYRLAISTSTIEVAAGDAAGFLFALQTLRRLWSEDPSSLPCLTLNDGPALPVRGFMLDVSRGKVPTMGELLRLVEGLHALRANQLQLYVEHTFAWPGHEDAWRDASPLTAAQVRALDDACAAVGIELVPNLNSFGHMERWLRHPRYRGLAECPEGWIHPLTGQFKEFPGTLRPDRASLDFVEALLTDYLPCFRSRQVNIGGDEPWELGQGWSKLAVAERGKHRVYLDHLRELCALTAGRGYRTQFWGDILLEDLALAQEAPADTTPVAWGYDAGHPFDAQAGRLRELGRTYLIAPGTSTWQSFTGRLDNALTNQREAVAAARTHGARGILLTSWGDNGNHQPWPTNWPAMAAGLTQAWTGAAPGELAAACAALGGLTEEDGRAVAAALTHLGRLDGLIAKANRNKSLTWDFLTAKPEAIAKFTEGVEPEELRRSWAHLDAAVPLLAAIPDASLREELAVGVDLARAGLQRAQGAGLSRRERGSLTERYQAAWLRRARPGGLDESVGLLFGAPAA